MRGRNADGSKHRGSIVLSTLVLLGGIAVTALICWASLSGGWHWELW